MSPRPPKNNNLSRFRDPTKVRAGRKKLFEELKGYYLWILLGAIFITGSVVIALISPQIVKEMTNEIATPSRLPNSEIDLDFVTKQGILMAILYSVSAVLGFISSFIFTSVGEYFSKDLRKRIAAKLNRLPLSYFDSTKTGDILSRVTNDVDSISESLRSAISSMIQAVFSLVGVIIAMFLSSWQLALIVLASLPLVLIVIGVMNFLAMPRFRQRQHVLGELEGIVEENYDGQMIIQSFGAEERTNQAFKEKNAELGRAMFEAQFFGGFMMPASNLVSYLAVAAVFLVAGLLMDQDSGISFGTISAFLIYINLFQSPLSTLAQAVNTMQSGSAASFRVYEFLGQKEQEDEDGKARKFLVGEQEQVAGAVTFDHVNFSYDPSREIIHDFSAKLQAGQKIAIVGPTGAGKTTMVNLLMRFYETNSGDILIDGVKTKDMPREEVRDLFAMVLQDTWVFEGSIRDNLIYNSKGISDEELWDVLGKCGLKHYVETLPGKLDYVLKDSSEISGGERQLLTLARAMLKKAPLLILDEATSNVDTRTEAKIQKAMDLLMKGKTSFVIAHRLSTITNADLILVMKDGNIVEQGKHEELMERNGFYASLYNSQFAGESI